jgi:hypothetical protein
VVPIIYSGSTCVFYLPLHAWRHEHIFLTCAAPRTTVDSRINPRTIQQAVSSHCDTHDQSWCPGFSHIARNLFTSWLGFCVASELRAVHGDVPIPPAAVCTLGTLQIPPPPSFICVFAARFAVESKGQLMRLVVNSRHVDSVASVVCRMRGNRLGFDCVLWVDGWFRGRIVVIGEVAAGPG